MSPADRLQLVHPTRERALGMSVLGIDLGAFFLTVRDIGADPALVLLTARALAIRGSGAVTFRDLGWVLGLGRRRVVGSLRRLSGAGAIVWHEEAGRGVIAVEIVPDLPGERPLFGPEDTPPFSTHALPSHWFVQSLPIVGRRAFLAYLYLRSRERRDGLTPPLLLSAVVRACRFRWVWQARVALLQLRRRRLIALGAGHRFAVMDPRPPSGGQRRLLRLLELGLLPPTSNGRRALASAALIPVALVVLALLSL